MKYIANIQNENDANDLIDKELNSLEERKKELIKSKIFNMKQGFVVAITELLQKEGIEEAKYLGQLERPIIFPDLGYQLSPRDYFDIQSLDKNIHYVLDTVGEDPFEPSEDSTFAAYAHRVEQNQYPILEKINQKVDSLLAQYGEMKLPRNHLGRVVRLDSDSPPLTQDLKSNMSIVLSKEDFQIWLALKEQHELGVELPKNNINEKTPANKLKI